MRVLLCVSWPGQHVTAVVSYPAKKEPYNPPYNPGLQLGFHFIFQSILHSWGNVLRNLGLGQVSLVIQESTKSNKVLELFAGLSRGHTGMGNLFFAMGKIKCKLG